MRRLWYILFSTYCLSQLVIGEELIQPSFNLTLLDNQPQDSDGNYLQCSEVGFRISAFDSNTTPSVVPPFLMIETEENGGTTTTFLGSNANQLEWPINHPQGSKVFFHVVDAEGHTSVAYSNDIVQSSGTANCLTSSSSSNFTVSFDKQQVDVCDTLTINMTGGTKPYTVMVIGARISNYTLGNDDDAFMFTNYINSGDTYQIAVADTVGQWASGANTVKSVGSSNSSCLGQSFGTHSSGSSDSETSQAPGANSTSSSSSSVNVAAIVGGIAGGVAFICLAATILICFHLRKRRQQLSETNRKGEFYDSEDISPYVTGKISPMTKPDVDAIASAPLLRDEPREGTDNEPRPDFSVSEKVPNRSNSDGHQSIYQHEDEEDSIELPPVYRVRKGSTHFSS